MAFKAKPVVNARLDQLSKKELIRTVKTLRGREKKLLDQVTGLQGAQITNQPVNERAAVEFGYRAGEKGVWNLEMTLHKWDCLGTLPVPEMDLERGGHFGHCDEQLDDLLERQAAATQRISAKLDPGAPLGDLLPDAVKKLPHRFPWETE